MSAIIDKATELLKEHWGHPTLKPEQEQVIEATMAGRDVFAMLATSGGKSVMFQIPAMLREGTTIVVTPLIALMKDQVASCKKRNISASYVSHQTDQWQTEERIDNLLKGEYQLFYVSPERLRSPKFIDVLCAVDIACFAADECHCFPAGTLVACEGGSGVRPIEQVEIGMRVWTYDHATEDRVARTVRDVRSREVDSLLKVITGDGNVLLVTPEHPFYVAGLGYLAAESLRPGDQVLHEVQVHRMRAFGDSARQAGEDSTVLQQPVLGKVPAPGDCEVAQLAVSSLPRDVHSQGQREQQVDTLLFSIMLEGGDTGAERTTTDSEVCHLLEAICKGASQSILLRSCVFAHSRGRIAVGTHDQKQSDAFARCARAAFETAKGRGCFQGLPWRERKGSDETTATRASMVSILDYGTSYYGWREGRWQTVDSQGRSVRSVEEAGDRGGWGVTPDVESKGKRCTAGCCVASSWVVSVTRLERGNYGFPGLVPGAPCRVYCLTVEDNENYFANGVLVHNCASRYGKDFRPAYNRVCDVVQHIEDSAKKRPPIIAVTATATPDIEKDIGRALGMRKWVRVIGDPIRPNFTYAVERGNDFARLRNLFRGQLDPNNGRYILYCGTQKSCEKVSEILRSMIDCPVAFYHAGMHRHDRADAQEDFTEGRTRIICATNAFGMGIDIPDIRAIIHLGIPGSVEDYVQEAGRAGRDGGPALALLIDNDYSHGLRQRFVDEANPDWALYEPVWNWLNKTFTDRSEVKAFNFTQASAQVSTEYNVPISSYLFAAVLDTMEAYGAIRSIPNATGQSLTVRAEKLRRAIEGNLIEDKSSREVAMALWETFVREAYEVRGEKTPASVASLEDIADSVNMSLNTVRDALRELSADRLLSLDAGSYGRPIRMTGFEEDLTEFLTAADVEDKRVREQRRLDTMLDYTLVADRAGFIRKYFTGQ